MTLFEIVPSPRRAASPHIDRAIWPLTANVDELGRLCVGETALTEVADEFGTPTYLIDEADFRHRIRCYRAAVPRGSIGLGRKGTPDHRCRELGGGRRRMSWRGFAWRARDRAHRWRRSEPDRAALVAVKDRRSRELVRRETIADLLARTASRRSSRGSGHLGVGADIWQRVTLSTTTSTPTHNPVDDRSVRRNAAQTAWRHG